METENSLASALPERRTLLADPAGYLKRQEITIRAWPRRRAAVLLAVLFWAASVICGVLMLVALMPRVDAVVSVVASLIVVIVASLASYWLGRYLTRWGSCILSVSGVQLISGGTEVFCPWALFSEPGQPVVQLNASFSLSPVPVAVVLPVASAFVPLVVARRNASVVAQGMDIKTRHVRFRSPHEIILKQLGGQEEWKDLAVLLLELGRSLGRPRDAGTFAGRIANPSRDEALGLRCPKCSSRAVYPRGNPSILDGKIAYQCNDCRLRMASLRSRLGLWSLLLLAILLSVGTSAVFVLFLIGGRDRQVHIIHLTVLVWFLFCIACVFAAIAELRKPVPIKDDGKDSGQ